jgi:hypothetical protein
MEDRENYDLRSVDNKEDRIREAMKKGSSYALEDLRELMWVADNRLKHCIHRKKELIAETLDALIVPIVGVGQLSFGLRPNNQVMRHGQPERGPLPLPKETLR